MRDRFEGALLGAGSSAVAAAQALGMCDGDIDRALAEHGSILRAVAPLLRAVPLALTALDDRDALVAAARFVTAPCDLEAAALVAGAVALNCQSERFVLSYFIDNLLELSERTGGALIPHIDKIPAVLAGAPIAPGAPLVIGVLASFAKEPTRFDARTGTLVGALIGARRLALPRDPVLRRTAAALERLSRKRIPA